MFGADAPSRTWRAMRPPRQQNVCAQAQLASGTLEGINLWLTAVICGLSLGVLLVRPRRVPDWAAVLVGALVLMLVGVLPPTLALAAMTDHWNVFLFFAGLSVAAASVERAGVFRIAAETAVRFSRGNQVRLVVGLYITGVLITAVLSNDATALLLTPVAFAVATRLGLDPRPYVFTCALVANAASFVLPVSNPANLLILTNAPMALGDFTARLWLASAVATVLTLGGLLIVFRSELRAPVGSTSRESSGLDRRVRVALAAAVVLAALYGLASAVNWPLGVVACLGAALLVLADALVAGWAPRELLREVPWTLFPLVAGLLLLVSAAQRVGLLDAFAQMIESAARYGVNGLPLVTLGMGVLANVLNNLPTALVAGSALATLPADVERENVAAAVMVGVNLGPNLTTVGSLATMVWLVVLRRRGLEVSALSYFTVGAITTLPALLAAAGAVWLSARVLGGA